jgi:hypothetical protein
MPRRFAVYHPSGQTAIKTDPFGKDIANIEMLRAFAHYGGYEHLHISTHELVPADKLAANLLEGAPGPRITTSTIMAQDGPAVAGTLLRGLPWLSELAWLRRHTVGDRAYSLVGLIHTIAPAVARERIAERSDTGLGCPGLHLTLRARRRREHVQPVERLPPASLWR